MKYFKFIIFVKLISIPFFINYQAKDTVDTSEIRNNIISYYKNVYLAEHKIISSKFDSAVFFYNKSAKFHNPFLIDCYNALFASLETNDVNSSIRFIEIMVKKGISIDYFYSNDVFSKIIDTPEWNNFMKTDIKPIYNSELHNYINYLFNFDQKFRKDDILYHDTLIKIDILVGKKIDSLFLEYGYLSEDLIGVFQEDANMFPRGWSPYDIILIHQVKLNKNKYKLFFENAVQNGKMRNSDLISHSINFGQDSNYLFKCFHFGMGDVHRVGEKYFTCGEYLEKKMNTNRERIFFCPLSHSIKCIQFNINSTPFILGGKPLNYPDLKRPESINLLIKEFDSHGYRRILLTN